MLAGRRIVGRADVAAAQFELRNCQVDANGRLVIEGLLQIDVDHRRVETLERLFEIDPIRLAPGVSDTSVPSRMRAWHSVN